MAAALALLLLPGASGGPPFHLAFSDRWPCVGAQQQQPNATRTTHCFWQRGLAATADLDWVKGMPFGADAITPPQTVLEGLARTPQGQRGVQINGALRLPGLPAVSKGFFDSNASVVLPWAGEFEERMTPVLSAWFGKFLSLGGDVDMIVMDWESQALVTLPAVALQQADNHSAGGCAKPSCRSAAALIEQDPRWPALQARLNARGEPFDVSFPSLIGWEAWAAQARSTDSAKARTAQYRTLVWNDLMIEQTAQILNRTVFEPARSYFPRVRSSNYAHYHLTPDWRLWTWPGGLPGGGAHVGTAQSKSFYNYGGSCGSPPHLARWTGCYVAQEATPYSEVNVSRSVFQTLLTSIRTVRGMAAAQVELMPWIQPRDYDGCESFDGCEFHGSALYQEQIMHMALSGVRRWLWWRWSKLPVMTGAALLAAVLAELDELLADDSREPLSLKEAPTPQDPWLLSGMVLPGSKQEVWRLTPRDNATTLTASQPATFRVPSLGLPAVVPVAGAEVLGRGNVSAAGWWLVRPD